MSAMRQKSNQLQSFSTITSATVFICLLLTAPSVFAQEAPGGPGDGKALISSSDVQENVEVVRRLARRLASGEALPVSLVGTVEHINWNAGTAVLPAKATENLSTPIYKTTYQIQESYKNGDLCSSTSRAFEYTPETIAAWKVWSNGKDEEYLRKSSNGTIDYVYKGGKVYKASVDGLGRGRVRYSSDFNAVSFDEPSLRTLLAGNAVYTSLSAYCDSPDLHSGMKVRKEGVKISIEFLMPGDRRVEISLRDTEDIGLIAEYWKIDASGKAIIEGANAGPDEKGTITGEESYYSEDGTVSRSFIWSMRSPIPSEQVQIKDIPDVSTIPPGLRVELMDEGKTFKSGTANLENE